VAEVIFTITLAGKLILKTDNSLKASEALSEHHISFFTKSIPYMALNELGLVVFATAGSLFPTISLSLIIGDL
jgi:hypothetical protein